jgi:hypothetical protein
LPTISHLPVTVTGAFGALLVALFELLFATGLLVGGAELFADALDEFTVTFPEQPMLIAAKIIPKTNDAIFIKYFLLMLRAILALVGVFTHTSFVANHRSRTRGV